MGNPDFSLYTINILNALKKPKQSYATTDFTYLKKPTDNLKSSVYSTLGWEMNALKYKYLDIT